MIVCYQKGPTCCQTIACGVTWYTFVRWSRLSLIVIKRIVLNPLF